MATNLLGIVNASKQLDVTLVDDNTPVPATAVKVGGVAHTPAGSLYVAGTPSGGTAPQGVTTVAGGIKMRVDGAVIVNSGGTSSVINGIPRVNDELSIALGITNSAVFTNTHNGIPMSSNAVLVNL